LYLSRVRVALLQMDTATALLTHPLAAATLGAGLSLLGGLLYLRDIGRRLTVPHRGSWLVWSAIGVIVAAAHGADGGHWALIVLWTQALTNVAILVVSLRRGIGGFSPANLVMLSVATCGVIGWLTLTDPVVATGCAALADGAGLVAIAPKTWADPHSETLATYALAGATGLLAALAVQARDPHLLLFPAYYFLGNTATACLIALRRRHRARTTAGAAYSPG
jgi:hypothetical protein